MRLSRLIALILALLLVACGEAPTATPLPPTLAPTLAPTAAPTLAPAVDAPATLTALPAPSTDSYEILTLQPPPADNRISYGGDSQQFGDLRLPRGKGPFPVVVVVHGGYWHAEYDLTYSGFMAAALTAEGVATWNIEYRRLGNAGGGWPGTFADVAAASDYLRTLAPQYNLDLSRVVTLGHSAGGQLALWLAGRGRIAVASPLYSADPLPLKGAVSLAGVADMQQGYDLRLDGGVVGQLLGGSPTEVADHYAATSPRALLPLGVPQRLLHGTADDIVPMSISESYTAAAQAAGDDAQLIQLDGAGHFQPVDPRAPEWLKVQAAVLSLLSR